ncbi:hypothetical protein DL765_011362 [Monosporascus sp. GIB2]|nr:hypothetical protein DL765_011362 [Monosporascus sp. GIB2]
MNTVTAPTHLMLKLRLTVTQNHRSAGSVNRYLLAPGLANDFNRPSIDEDCAQGRRYGTTAPKSRAARTGGAQKQRLMTL